MRVNAVFDAGIDANSLAIIRRLATIRRFQSGFRLRVASYQAGSSGTAMPVGLYSSGVPASADSRLDRNG